MRETCPSGLLVDGAAVNSEAGCQVVQGDAVGVPSQLRGTIRGIQTGLRLTRIYHDRSPLIDPLASLSA